MERKQDPSPPNPADAKPATQPAAEFWRDAHLNVQQDALDEYTSLLRAHFSRPLPAGVLWREVEPEVFAAVRHSYPTLTKQEWEGMRYVERLPYLKEALAGKAKPATDAPPKSDESPPAGALQTIGKGARAMALLVEHPDWTDADIAHNVPCHRTSLYRFPMYVAARKLLEQGRRDMPRGSKSKDGDVEAWDE